MGEFWASLGPSSHGRGRAIQFVAATAGEGASTVAREFAFFVATRTARRVWLVDLDVLGEPQALTIAKAAERYGPLGPPASGSPDGSAFFTVKPPLLRPDGRPWPDTRYLAAYAVGTAHLWVTRFRRDALNPRQSVHILPTGDYWSALRRCADLVVVDAPPADRSQAALTVAPFIEETVLVVAADQPNVVAPGRLRDAVTAAGGHCRGLFLNRASVQPPGFLKSAV